MTTGSENVTLQKSSCSTSNQGGPLYKILSRPEYLPQPIPRPMRRPQYHYTSLEALDGILKDGEIKTCRHYVDEERLPENDFALISHLACDVTWTSSAPVWEPAAKATNMICATRRFAIDDFVTGHVNSVARIEVDSETLYEWSSYLFMTGVDCDHVRGIVESGYRIESDPDDWAICPHPIQLSAMLSIEIWNGYDWMPIDQSEDPAMARYVELSPCIYPTDIRDGLSAGGIWVKDVRDKGGVEWLDFLRAKYIFQLESHMQARELTKSEIAKIVCHDESIHPVYRVLMAIQTLPECCASRVIAEVADDAIECLEGNPLFARAVEKYCGLDQQVLIQTIRRFSLVT